MPHLFFKSSAYCAIKSSLLPIGLLLFDGFPRFLKYLKPQQNSAIASRKNKIGQVNTKKKGLAK